MKVYAISGLGADERVFKFLNLQHELIPLGWIPNHPNDTLKSYSKKLSSFIKTDEPYAIIGVSFGGLVATELNNFLNSTCTILISSISKTNELPYHYRLFSKLNILPLIPQKLLKPPRFLSAYFFGAENKNLLYKILEDTDLSFVKWALYRLITWRNNESFNNLYKINGDRDRLLKPTENSIIISGGSHFMIVDKADEISKVVNKILLNYS